MKKIILIAVLGIAAFASCSPKYGCDATKNSVGYHPYKHR